MEEVDVTEQSYANAPDEPVVQSQLDVLLQRIAALEQQVIELQLKLAQPQGGVFPP